jgi:hypothetical protein
MNELEQRLEAIETELALQRDHLEIRQIIASYGPMVDTSDTLQRSEKLSKLWTEDGVYDIGGVGAKHGRDDIAQVFAENHFGMVPTGVCHVMGLPHVRIDKDKAVALNYSCVFRPEGERFYAWRISANQWEFIRVNGKWLVDKRMNRLMTGDPDTLQMLRAIDAMVAQKDRP